MSKVLSHYFYLLILVVGHKIYRWYNTKKEGTTSEKEEDSDKFRENLDSFIYKIGFIIIISYAIEILSGIYFANEIIQTFKHFDEQGITSAKLFNGRCSGAYYYKYSCDQKDLADILNSCDITAEALSGALDHQIAYENFKEDSFAKDFGDLGHMNYYKNREFSGIHISCSPGHSKKLKEQIVKYKWDGPIPVHGKDDCKKTNWFDGERWGPIFY
ncbi:hypothetical protein CONCODRAFT_80644 [Conidiobolus coronatus NRRL 28638]|uniref:Uncharacterized protein n=1 Tax=Conidiobolus coronatus (strain ATCC 28846 / CBS 209.66 / NRRL 28638) TaxID=796925 RepID=A0A137NT07_CONC2|nr:hypothetical protein CONCODRAFT_80644 [Conidiobolus coronatus NRRL 28638]|eukprot:KXN65925.1 hypothetical protein CONCODRAFT_80644 [Conidiobolus coronatus NRRL 28638]